MIIERSVQEKMSIGSTMLWDELKERGFIFSVSAEERLKERLQKPLTLYIGFDATAPAFHVGHLMIFMLLRHFQKAGHQVIALLGGGTTRIGDPSDKNAERPLMSKEAIETNIKALQVVLEKMLDQGALRVVNNADWLGDINYLDFLRDVGRHFSVNRLVGFDFVKRRLEQNKPLSFLELNYILLQSYDFLSLSDRYDCCLQLGGQDQWANILSGVELVHKARQKEVFGVTCPLLTTASGQKMGKTAQGAVWLDADKFSPYDFWQFWRNTSDADTARFLRLYTELPLQEIAQDAALEGVAINRAKEKLADCVTQLVHGEERLKEARAQTASLFENTAADDALSLNLKEPLDLLSVIEKTGFVSSRSEARRMVRSGAVRLDNAVQDDEKRQLTPSLLKDKPLKLSVGKKRHIFLKS